MSLVYKSIKSTQIPPHLGEGNVSQIEGYPPEINSNYHPGPHIPVTKDTWIYIVVIKLVQSPPLSISDKLILLVSPAGEKPEGRLRTRRYSQDRKITTVTIIVRSKHPEGVWQ